MYAWGISHETNPIKTERGRSGKRGGRWEACREMGKGGVRTGAVDRLYEHAIIKPILMRQLTKGSLPVWKLVNNVSF